MYIKKVNIKNIRAISDFEMHFDQPAGWHVLIGDNGTGKSSVVQAISLALVGNQIQGIAPNWEEWLMRGKEEGTVALEIEQNLKSEKQTSTQNNSTEIPKRFPVALTLKREEDEITLTETTQSPASKTLWTNKKGWFSAAYGPFRRFTGGEADKSKIFKNPSYQRLAAHLSLFGEDVALTEATEWLKELMKDVDIFTNKNIEESYLNKLESFEKEIKESNNVEEFFKKFIVQKKREVIEEVANKIRDYIPSGKVMFAIHKLFNSSNFLPNNTKLNSTFNEITFTDGFGNKVQINQMSDGYRSILSLTFELLRQMINSYGEEAVFENINKGEMTIPCSGVVLVDEIDAHLHPSWQTRIGQWFTQYFPNIQFIVTTHSPLVCRACDKGSIWRLAAPNDAEKVGKIVGTDKDKLVFGNILDAYGTELFGESPVRSDRTDEKAARLGKLNMLSAFGKISDEEEKERQHLQNVLMTDATAY